MNNHVCELAGLSEWSKAGREGVVKIGRKEGRTVGSEGVREQ